jgi:hypothetical protein
LFARNADTNSHVLRLDGIRCKGSDPSWLDRPAMMKIPVSSPAVLGRLKGFCKPYDFVLAPILRNDKLDLEHRPKNRSSSRNSTNIPMNGSTQSITTFAQVRSAGSQPEIKGMAAFQSRRIEKFSINTFTTQSPSLLDPMDVLVILGLVAYCSAVTSLPEISNTVGRKSNEN